jgi:ribosomal protein S20
MPILANAKKALRVSKRKAAVNQPVRSRLKTAVDGAKKKATPESLSSAFSAVDKAVKRNIIHRKKAARIKSNLAKTAASADKSAKK